MAYHSDGLEIDPKLLKEYMKKNKTIKRKKPILKKIIRLQDVNTLDIDEITIEGYNFREISEAIKFLLTKDGIEMYKQKHKWKILSEKDLESWGLW